MVCLYLPRHLSEAEGTAIEANEETAADVSGDGKTVLVVDDEPLIRMIIVDVLEDLGFKSLETEDGVRAMEVLRSAGSTISLLITDVGLPNGMNGRQVADAARQLLPTLPVLFVTGYAENAVLSHGHLDPGMQVATKPFDVDRLKRKIADLTDNVSLA